MEDTSKLLFGNIEYSDDNEFKTAMEELTPDKAVVLLVAACSKAQALNIYTDKESEAVIKSISKLIRNDRFIS